MIHVKRTELVGSVDPGDEAEPVRFAGGKVEMKTLFLFFSMILQRPGLYSRNMSGNWMKILLVSKAFKWQDKDIADHGSLLNM